MWSWRRASIFVEIEIILCVKIITFRPITFQSGWAHIGSRPCRRAQTQELLCHQPLVGCSRCGLDFWLSHDLFDIHSWHVVAERGGLCADVRQNAHRGDRVHRSIVGGSIDASTVANPNLFLFHGVWCHRHYLPLHCYLFTVPSLDIGVSLQWAWRRFCVVKAAHCHFGRRSLAWRKLIVFQDLKLVRAIYITVLHRLHFGNQFV